MADEVTLDEIYKEVEKRIEAAIAKLKTELLAEIAKKQNAKEPFKIVRGATGS